HNVGVMKLGGVADLAEKAVAHAAAVDPLEVHDLEYLLAAHELVFSEVHDPHTAPAQLAQDLEVRKLEQFRRSRASTCQGERSRGAFGHRSTGGRTLNELWRIW